MNSRLQTRVGLGLLATAFTLTLLAEAHQPQPRLRASTEAPTEAKAPGRNATELEEHVCQENAYRGEPPANGDCSWIPDGPIQEDDLWGRWNCYTMGNRLCTPPPTGWLTFELGRTG